MTALIFSLWLTTCPVSITVPTGACETVKHVCKRSECMEIIRRSWAPGRWIAGAVLQRVP